jgi:integrase
LEEGLNGLQPVQKQVRLNEMWQDHLEKKKAKWSPRTYQIALEAWKKLSPVFGNKYPHEITAPDLGRYRDKKLAAHISGYSINREIGFLRSLLVRAKAWENIRKDYTPVHLQMQSGVALTDEQEERLLVATQKSNSLCLRVVVVLALSTGMRYTELRLLQWANVSLDLGYLVVGCSKTDAGRGRRILLPTRAHRALLAWAARFPDRLPFHYVFCHERYGMKNHQLTEHKYYDLDPSRPMGSFNVAWRFAKRRAKLKLRFHDLRHTVVTRLLEGGTPFNTVALMMGWSPANMVLMVRKYGHLMDKSWKEAVKLLEGPKGNDRGSEAQVGAAAPAPNAGDSREEEPVQSDAAAGDDPSAKKGGSSEAA